MILKETRCLILFKVNVGNESLEKELMSNTKPVVLSNMPSTTEMHYIFEAINRSSGIIEFDAVGNILFANQIYLDLLGYTFEEIKGKNHSVFVAPNHFPNKQYQEFWKRIQNGEFVSQEIECISKSGKKVWLKEIYNPILSSDGEIQRIIAITLDISSFKLHQRESVQRLTQIEDVYQFISDAAIISRTDAHGKINFINDKFISISGYSQDELIGQDHRIVNSGMHARGMWQDMYNTVLQEKKVWNTIVTNRAKNGSLYYVDTYIKADFDPQTGKLQGYTSIRQDLTSLKKQELEFRYNMEAINKSNAVAEFDTHGILISANNIFTKLFCYAEDEIIGKHHQIFVDQVYALSEEYKEFWNKLSQGEFVSTEFQRYTKDGRSIWIQATYNPIISETGAVDRILKIATDITDRIESNREIDRKNSYLEHAAKILRHDMHSGINVYIPRGLNSLVKRLPPAAITEYKIDAPIKLIREGLIHTQKVYRGVYEFTNLVKPGATLDLIDLDLLHILNSFLKTTSYKDQVKLEPLCRVRVSESLFCTAIDNLIRNGLKYNDSSNKLVNIYMEDEKTLVVSDNGRGMTQQEFEYFSKTGSRREGQKEDGSGLGLGICVAILQEHGFQISCEQNNGSNIKIKLK